MHRRQLALRERREPGGVPVGRGSVVGEPYEGAAHAEGARPDSDAQEFPRVARGVGGAGLEGCRVRQRQGEEQTGFRSVDAPHQVPPRDSRAMGENEG